MSLSQPHQPFCSHTHTKNFLRNSKGKFIYWFLLHSKVDKSWPNVCVSMCVFSFPSPTIVSIIY